MSIQNDSPEYKWYPGHLAGHARYCAHPCHPPAALCAADPAEPATMRGEPSRAWITDHQDSNSNPIATGAAMNDKSSPGYARPTGRELPGEHGNARMIHELAGTAPGPPAAKETAMNETVKLVADLAANGLYEPGQYVKSAQLRAGELHDDGQGGAWFYAETTDPDTDVERVRVTVTPA